MKRNDFLKSVLGASTMAFIPSSLSQIMVQYEKVYLKQCFVRGFAYYEGPKILDTINYNGLLELVREPENKVDKRAIALYFNKQKIGYIPRESNKTMSILMDTQLLKFHAEITHIEKEAETWEQLRIAVYVLKEIKTDKDLNLIKPYQVLHTPHYTSFNLEDNQVLHIYNDAV